MIFVVSIEGNNNGSGMVNVRAVFLGHVIDFHFLDFSICKIEPAAEGFPISVQTRF
jgi:hypothetical protein